MSDPYEQADRIARALGVTLTAEERIAVANKPADFIETWLRRKQREMVRDGASSGDRYVAAKLRKQLERGQRRGKQIERAVSAKAEREARAAQHIVGNGARHTCDPNDDTSPTHRQCVACHREATGGEA